jgi:hypothetical protein
MTWSLIKHRDNLTSNLLCFGVDNELMETKELLSCRILIGTSKFPVPVCDSIPEGHIIKCPIRLAVSVAGDSWPLEWKDMFNIVALLNVITCLTCADSWELTRATMGSSLLPHWTIHDSFAWMLQQSVHWVCFHRLVLVPWIVIGACWDL